MTLTAEVRRFVRERAGDCCEYCRVAQVARAVRFQVDHIIAIKHGGTDTDDNLCLSCYECNGFKGSNVAALDPLTGLATRLYDPRRQVWAEHFEMNADATLSGLTPEGRTTLLVLRLNDSERVQQRLGEVQIGAYPC